MKRAKIILFSVLMLALSGTASATSLESQVLKLKSYTKQSLEVTAIQDESLVGEKTQEMLKTIDEVTTLISSGKEKATLPVVTEILRVAALTFDNDPSEAAAELILPLYKSHKNLVEQAYKLLPAKDVKALKESLKNSQREETQGNG